MSRITKLAAEEIVGLALDRQRLKTLKQELAGINAKLYSPRGATLDAVPVRGGGNKQEEKLVKMIDDPRRESLKKSIADTEARIKAIEDALAELSDIERQIIAACYQSKERSLVRLMHKTNYSEAYLIRKKLDALRKYAYMRGLDVEK